MFLVSTSANPNYLAKIVKINNIHKHSNADRLQVTTIDGNTVITAGANVGDIVFFFPLECTINKEYLAWSNSFEDKTLNKDSEKKGFFNNKARVRAVKLRGQPSMGYIVPFQSIKDWLKEEKNIDLVFSEDLVDTEFDTIKDILMCQKYLVRVPKEKQVSDPRAKGQRRVARQSRLVEDQFRLHIDTPKLGVNMHRLSPESLINITAKAHGTSAVFSKVLTKKKLGWKDKVAKFFGANIQEQQYDFVHSSRKVIKNQYFNDNKLSQGYYGEDIWSKASKEINPYLENGMTIYAEIVGFLEGGGYIQKGYDYGCQPGQHQVYIYRITFTNDQGKVTEYSANQVQEWCNLVGLKAVPLYYQGKARNLFNHIDTEQHWHENFLQCLQSTYLEKDDPLCVNKVPDEGICLRVEGVGIEVYKLRSFRFMEKESKDLDTGEVDIESTESE